MKKSHPTHRHQPVPAHQDEPGPSRATGSLTHIPASHGPGSAILIIESQGTRKRKHQGTASTSSPRKRHRESAIQRNAAAIHTERREDEDSDPDCDDPDEDDGKYVRNAARSLQCYLDAVEYPADPKQLGSQFLQEVCNASQKVPPQPTIAQRDSPPRHLGADDAGGVIKNAMPQVFSHPAHSAAEWTAQKRKRRGTSKKTCPYSEISGCTRSFTRAADLEHHLIFSHLGLGVSCTNKVHGRPVPLSRPDSVPRHMGKAGPSTCMGPTKFLALKRKVARELVVPADSKAVQRAILQKYVRIRMPCYQQEDAQTTLALLKSKSRVAVLERWLGDFGRVVRCGCQQCTDPPVDHEDPGVLRGRAVSSEESDVLTPEDEEGVDDGLEPEVKQEVEDALLPEDDERADERHTPDSKSNSALEQTLPSNDVKEESEPLSDHLYTADPLAATPTDKRDPSTSFWDHHPVKEEEAPSGIPDVLCDLEELIDTRYLSESAYDAHIHESYYDVDDELWTLAQGHQEFR
ncbi:hypothetical protein C8Q80DRAFT_1272489 [Daedaleopsis nitida]|nr:hypothetical protein C8Q80DRAFT_1272489 [Daedaleopsis nitida]